MDYLLSSAQKYNLKFQRILSKFNNTFLYFQEIHFQNLIMGLLEIIPSASAAKKILFQSLLHTEKGNVRLKKHPCNFVNWQNVFSSLYVCTRCNIIAHRGENERYFVSPCKTSSSPSALNGRRELFVGKDIRKDLNAWCLLYLSDHPIILATHPI